MKQLLTLKGRFALRCVGPDGREKWRRTLRNGITDEGVNKILDVMFHGVTQIATWYVGLIEDSGSETLAAGDTLASHGGWTECTSYSGNRKEWTEGAASGKSIASAGSSDFTMNATKTLVGAFLCSAASGTTGTLFCTALFDGGDESVDPDDVVEAEYTVEGASA